MLMLVITPIIAIFLTLKNQYKYSDICLAFLFFIFCIYYGFSRSFFVFFFGFLILAGLFVSTLIVTFLKFANTKSLINLSVSLLLMICSPKALLISSNLCAYPLFYEWAFLHPIELSDAMGQDGYFKEIHAWGWGSSDTSLMLATSYNYDLTKLNDQKLWKKKYKINCEMGGVFKVYPNMYTIFTDPYVCTN